MTKNKKFSDERLKIYIKPQSISDCFIATMDPSDPFKICLFPSIQSKIVDGASESGNEPDELDSLFLHNYLKLRRNCLNNK